MQGSMLPTYLCIVTIFCKNWLFIDNQTYDKFGSEEAAFWVNIANVFFPNSVGFFFQNHDTATTSETEELFKNLNIGLKILKKYNVDPW
jgi:hypothetical protein